MQEIEALQALGGRIVKIWKGTKRPVEKWAQTSRVMNDRELQALLKENNVGMIADEKLVFLDVEGPKKLHCPDGRLVLSNIEKYIEKLPFAPHFATPSGGLCIVFRAPDGALVPYIDLSQTHGLELRTGLHFNLMPPSVFGSPMHTSDYSGKYEWNVTPQQVINSEGEIPVVPEWLVNWFCEQAPKRFDAPTLTIDNHATRAGYLEIVEDNLWKVSADIPYPEWWRLMAICHRAGEKGKELFVQWSRETGGKRWNDKTEAFINRQWHALDNSLKDKEAHSKPLLGLTALFEYVRAKNNSSLPVLNVESPSQAAATPQTNNDESDEAVKLRDQVLIEKWPLMPLTGALEQFRLQLAESMPWQSEALYALPLVCLQLALQRRVVYRADGLQSHWWAFIGGPASNKTECKRIIKEIIAPIDTRIMLDGFESSNGIKSILAEYPSRCLLMDEGLKVFNSVLANEGRSPLDAKTLGLVLNMHNNKSALEATANRLKAHRVPRIVLPQLSVATFDQDDYWQQFRSGNAINNGLLSRFFVVRLNPMPKRYAEKERPRITAAEIRAFSEAIKRLIPYQDPNMYINDKGQVDFGSSAPIDLNAPSQFEYGEGTRDVFRDFNDSLIPWAATDEDVRIPILHRLSEGQKLLAQLLAIADNTRIVSEHHARIAAGLALRTCLAVGAQMTSKELGLLQAVEDHIRAHGPSAISTICKHLPGRFRREKTCYSANARFIREMFPIKDNKAYLP